MVPQDIEQFVASLKEDLDMEESLIDEYSKAIIDGNSLDSLSDLERGEIIKIIEILRSDSVWHKKAIAKLIEDAKENPWS